MEPACDLTIEQHRTLVAALQAALGTAAEPVERLETHISTLLLHGPFADKLRQPRVLPFLDFSTAAARRHDCEEERRLNRRTAPQLYLEVRPVLGTPEAPRIGEPGDDAAGAIDWLLRMRRFDDGLLLDRLAARGALTDALVEALARRVADFHAALPASPAAWGDPAAVLAWARANFTALRDRIGAARQVLCDLHDWTEHEFEHIAPRLARRRAQGHVREGHGDLHLGNIVLIDGEPLPFDAIEFNPALRHGDTMGDAAFVAMDLWRHGLPRAAWRFASAYAERGGDHDGLPLLPFFAVYRALVRAQVAAIRGDEAALRRDLRCAASLAALRRARPMLLLVSGVSGSGKSTVALELLQALGALRLRSDAERKRLAGVAVTARPTPEQARTLYGTTMTQRTYARLNAIAADLLRAGLNVVVDAAALRRDERDAMRRLAQAAGADFRIVECLAPEPVLRERITRRIAENHDASDATLAVLDLQWRVREPLAAEEDALTLDTHADRATVAQRCEALADRLRDR